MDADQEDAAADPEVSDVVGRTGRWRVVIGRRLLVLLAVGVVLAVGIVCRLSI